MPVAFRVRGAVALDQDPFVGRTSMAGFGRQEPVAFLASWICAASRFTDRAAHMRYAPGQAEVCAAMASLGSSGVEA